ncbi:uncharacterized protein LOC116696891 isoform X3 [Etheostoma spectabile]|uniref:uncharacterized protein LOC116696891 isoform X3 n=1 Tax=Etheostoma spectabile TaxID=54343 RepID=UPI0013AEB3DB|nr:uncharacterized protein LOC116696891 isoform X3 [Etheostoma spectabile]
MEAVVGLLLILLRISHAVETYCDGRQDGARCYGALGGTVVLQLMDNASEIFGYTWSIKPTIKKTTTTNTTTSTTTKTTKILEGRKNLILSNEIADRSFFTPSNGTFRINDLIWTDGGEYELQTFDSNGKVSEQRTLQLTIQAPVSSVLLVPECLSQGEMKVSCSFERGDSPQYSWTLDGRTLTDAELLSGNTETNNITLRQKVSGRLVCSVRNQVSKVSKEMTISTCAFINCTLTNGTHISQWMFPDNNISCIQPTTSPPMRTSTGKTTGITVSIYPCTNNTSYNHSEAQWYINYLLIAAGVLVALVILLVVGVAVVCAQKKKRNNKLKEEEDNELTYADVRFAQRPGRQMQQRPETEGEVEYGQVKFSERPQQTVEPAGDECVYAKVRKDR